MPFERPTLTELRTQVAQDIATNLPGADALLRTSNLRVTGDALAGLAHLHYGYLDWIASQSVPFTATGEFLEAWAGLIGIVRKGATQASGSVAFTNCVTGSVIPAGSSLIRGDGVTYTTGADATVDGSGNVTVTATADADPTGLTGAFGNCDIGTAMTLGSSIEGIQSTGAASVAFTGGADAEDDDSLRNRMLARYQQVPQGGCAADYVTWAKEVPGVTRAWVTPLGQGAGTVVVYVMLDDAQAAHNGFPQGTDGVATNDVGVHATGDQLTVADYIYPLQPATAHVYVVSPIASPINFTITGLTSDTLATRAALEAAIADVFRREGSPGGTVYLSHIESAISAVQGIDHFVITTPAGNITSATGYIPTLGTVTYA